MPRILFIATLHSSLAARWITQLANTEWDVHVFGIDNEIHPLFCSDNITVHSILKAKNPGSCKVVRHPDLYPFQRGRYRLEKLPRLAQLLRVDPASTLSSLILELQPDCIHSLKMQHEAYLTYNALQQLPSQQHAPWLYSVWGSDIYFHRRFPEHLERISRVLEQVDYLLADNPRDISLALSTAIKE